MRFESSIFLLSGLRLESPSLITLREFSSVISGVLMYLTFLLFSSLSDFSSLTISVSSSKLGLSLSQLFSEPELESENFQFPLQYCQLFMSLEESSRMSLLKISSLLLIKLTLSSLLSSHCFSNLITQKPSKLSFRGYSPPSLFISFHPLRLTIESECSSIHSFPESLPAGFNSISLIITSAKANLTIIRIAKTHHIFFINYQRIRNF